MNKSNSSEEKELHLYKETEVKVPIHLKITLTIREAAEYSNIGINKIDSMLKQPNCPFVLYVGTRKLVKRKEFEEYIRRELIMILSILVDTFISKISLPMQPVPEIGSISVA